MRHSERHRTHRTGWLRAAVLGANDGIVSTASLVLGVADRGEQIQKASLSQALPASLLVRCQWLQASMSRSVHKPIPKPRIWLVRGKSWLQVPSRNTQNLMAIYVKRGLDEALASNVATQLMTHDALAAHGRDELGISDTLAAKPVQAAFASAGTFAVGALLPLLMVQVLPVFALMWGLAGSSLLFLALLGLLAARAGGAPVIASVTRVTFGGHWQWD